MACIVPHAFYYPRIVLIADAMHGGRRVDFGVSAVLLCRRKTSIDNGPLDVEEFRDVPRCRRLALP